MNEFGERFMSISPLLNVPNTPEGPDFMIRLRRALGRYLFALHIHMNLPWTLMFSSSDRGDLTVFYVACAGTFVPCQSCTPSTDVYNSKCLESSRREQSF
jgi:hypothetical protein